MCPMLGPTIRHVRSRATPLTTNTNCQSPLAVAMVPALWPLPASHPKLAYCNESDVTVLGCRQPEQTSVGNHPKFWSTDLFDDYYSICWETPQLCGSFGNQLKAPHFCSPRNSSFKKPLQTTVFPVSGTGWFIRRITRKRSARTRHLTSTP